MKQTIAYFAAIIVAVAIACSLRMVRLDARPMHADEAVQAARFRSLWLADDYRYDPNEYHGPTLPYATLPAVWIGQHTTFADTTKSTYRIVPVLFGIGMILLLTMLAGVLGRATVVIAAILLAVSPPFVFYSRYYIHETLLVAFTLAAIGGAVRYWQDRRGWWVCWVGVCIGCMQATKETVVISYAAAGGAAVALWLLALIVPSYRESLRSLITANSNAGLERRSNGWHAVAVVLVALAVAGVLFSSFFTNARGPIDGLRTYLPWLHRAGGASPHIHPAYFYLQRLFWWHSSGFGAYVEWPIAVLGACVAIGSFRGGGRDNSARVWFVRWLTLYTLLQTLAYSVIPYKTPWCLLQFWIGWLMLASVGVAQLLSGARARVTRILSASLVTVVACGLVTQAYQLSFNDTADRTNPYLYAHTSAGIEKLARQVEEVAKSSAARRGTVVKVLWDDPFYWPLPWYLRRFEHVEYWQTLPDDAAAPIIIAAPSHDTNLTKRLGRDYLMTDYFEVRPGVLAQLWVEFDLWEAHLHRLGRI